ncbi:MAG: hypothetical protein FJX67_18830 [Alphaproteobacteria bacterium]|nr:hypothetical protein [Alphaproteobacteria bacterium]
MGAKTQRCRIATAAIAVITAIAVAATVEAAAQQTPAEKRAAENAVFARAAAARGTPDIRGLALGMTLPEVERKLGAEIARLEPERKPDWRPPAFYNYTQNYRLTDGSLMAVTYTSPITGAIASTILYEQTLREGPAPERMLAELERKYGAIDQRTGSGYWLTWHLRSRLPVDDGLGSFLKAHFRADKENRVDYLRLVLNDYKFAMHDEQTAAEARRESDRRAVEQNRSGSPRF